MIEELIPWVIYIGLPKLNNTHVPCHLRALPSYQGALASTTATAAKKSLLKWIRVFSNFVAFIPIHWNCEMWANFLGVDFLGTGLTLRKKKGNSAPLVYVLHKSWNYRHFHVLVVQWRQRNVQKVWCTSKVVVLPSPSSLLKLPIISPTATLRAESLRFSESSWRKKL